MDLRAFSDELTKIAITLEDLKKLTLLAKRKMVKIPGLPAPSTITRQNKAVQLQQLRALGDQAGASQADKFLTPLVGKVIAPRRGGDVARQFEKSLFPGMSKEITQQMRAANPELAQALEQTKASPVARRALEGIVKGHELEELAKAHKGWAGHHAKGVLPVEHNILSTLPAEAEPARKLMQAVREAGGERSIFEAATGGRIPFGEGPRLSRHAVRRLGERIKQISDQRLEELRSSLQGL